jgi:hypothetical protein
MNTRNYSQANDYARKLTRNLNNKESLDLVHDAYLIYHKRTGKDLFDEPQGRIRVVLLNLFYECTKKNTIQGGGDNHNRWASKKFVSIPYKIYRHNYTFDDQQVNNVTPLDICIANDTLARYKKLCITSSGKLKHILILKGKGFKNTEIGEWLGVSKQLVAYYIKQANLGIILN